MPSITLQFTPAPADLAPWVAGFAERRDAPGVRGAARELPMANPMIQFMFGGDYLVEGEVAPRAALWGPTLRPAASATLAPARVFMIVLTGLGAARLARSDLRALVDRRIELGALDGGGWADLSAGLEDQPGFPAAAAFAAEVLRRWLARPDRPPSRPLLIADGVLRHRIRGSVEQLAGLAGLGPRGLHKAFLREVGCGPKRLLRIARLQRVLRALHPRPWAPEPPEDATLEYADQAHLDRDFLDLAGLSRCAYLAAKRSGGDQLVHTVV